MGGGKGGRPPPWENNEHKKREKAPSSPFILIFKNRLQKNFCGASFSLKMKIFFINPNLA